ncbi:MAG: ATP-grasp domain-containing protein [Candidatus Moranbacteria bacterium]|nr:ATP-grasp domain-containing protein [Candidatus Moranbacteria bacterium]
MLLILKSKQESSPETQKGIDMLIRKLTEKGIETEISSMEKIELFISNEASEAFIDKKPLSRYKAVFFRRVGKKRSLASILSNIAKKNGILFIDKLYENSNDPGKLSQMFFLSSAGIPVPKTYFSSQYDSFSMNRAEKFLGLPMVVKFSQSRKGLGVFLAKNKEEALEITRKNPEEEIILQEFIPNDFDYRVLVLGDEAACVIKRERPDKKEEFRNNVHLGASEEFMDLSKVPPFIKSVAVAAAKLTNIQVAGVDVVVDKNNDPFIFEVNRSPAFTYDEKVSDETSVLADYLCEYHQGKK